MFDEIFPILATTDLPRALGFAVTYQFPAEGPIRLRRTRPGHRPTGPSPANSPTTG